MNDPAAILQKARDYLKTDIDQLQLDRKSVV